MDLPVGAAPGASGLVASSTMKNVFFVVDDAKGTSDILAVNNKGMLLGRIPVEGMSARNAEALAAGPCQGETARRCLFVGDIGDNVEQRTHITIDQLAEPTRISTTPIPALAWDYHYADGPHNAEAMVMAGNGSLVVITKSAPDDKTGVVPPHRIYRGALGGGPLTLVGTFTPPTPKIRLQSLLTGTVVTDAALANGRLLLLTYDEVVDYRAPSPSADPATFPSWPHRQLPHPPLIQTEGIALDAGGCGYEVASEEGPGGSHASMAAVTCH